VAAVIRVTGGNFRLLGRLLTQAERILEINGLTRMTAEVIDAARESLVIGQPRPTIRPRIRTMIASIRTKQTPYPNC
jgi:hypothetical protein